MGNEIIGTSRTLGVDAKTLETYTSLLGAGRKFLLSGTLQVLGRCTLNFRATSLILVILLTFFSFSVEASNVQTVMVLGDTYVEAYALSSAFGREPYLRVAESESSISFAFLMFNLSGVSYVFNASSEIELRLYCHNVTSPYVTGVHWCLNNTWNEDTLTFESIQNFSRSDKPESVVTVSSNNTWYEWTVTGFVGHAMQQPAPLDKITLVLQAENSVSGDDYVFFYSKDQNLPQYYPRLVFSYKSSVINPNPMDTYLKVGLVSVVVAGIILVAYRFSRKKKRKGSFRKSFSKANPKCRINYCKNVYCAKSWREMHYQGL
jgi:hypothetical protein